MAIKFLSAIDLGGLEIQNSRFQHLTAAQITSLAGSALYTGRMVYDSTNNTVKFYDGSNWIDVSGDIQGVTAGTGLTGGGTSGAVTVSLSHLGLESLVDPNADRIFFWDDSAGASKFLTVSSASGVAISGTTLQLASIPNSSLTNSTIQIIGGAGLTGGGTATALGGSSTLAVGAGTGITVNADDIQIKNAGNFSNNTLLKWGSTDGQLVNSSITDDGTTVTIGANLTVTGTTTYVNSNTVEIGDSIILLNADATGAASEDAGFEIERGTDANVKFIWDESEDYFSTVDKPLHVGTVDTMTPAGDDFFYMYENATGETGIIKKANVNTVADLMGAAKWFTLDPTQDSVSKTGNAYTITHDYNTQKIIVQIVDSSTFETVNVDVTRPTTSTVKVTFGGTVTDSAYIAILNAAKLNGDSLAYEGLSQGTP